jgi:arylsulfatase A-like enzyme
MLDAYERMGLLDTTAVVVTSDHGGSTISRRAQPAKDLATKLNGGGVAENGGSVFVYSTDAAAISAIRALDYAGPIFTRDGHERTFPFTMIGLDGPRAPDIVFSFTWSDDAAGGLPGAAVGTPSKLLVDHGSTSPHELRNTLVAAGPDFRSGWRDPLPVGNIDICPTLTQLLHLESGSQMDGRVLEEALRQESGPTAAGWHEESEQALSFSARGREWRQRVWFEHAGAHAYLTGGVVEPEKTT